MGCVAPGEKKIRMPSLSSKYAINTRSVRMKIPISSKAGFMVFT
jgi:hypothetical protein